MRKWRVQMERSKGRWRRRWRGCGQSDKERLHCNIVTAIHFVLLCVVFSVVPVDFEQPAARRCKQRLAAPIGFH